MKITVYAEFHGLEEIENFSKNISEIVTTLPEDFARMEYRTANVTVSVESDSIEHRDFEKCRPEK